MAIKNESLARLPSEALLTDILESVTDAVVTIDEDHKVLLCNKAAEEMFGFKCSEIVGQDASPLIPNPHQSVHRSYLDRYLETGIPRVIGKARECYGLRRDGTSFPVEISYSVSKTAGRMYFTAIIRDISQRKEREQEIRFMERLADIGKAVAHIVHEIRKPLVSIGGFARQVRRCSSLEDDQKALGKLDIIVEEVRRLDALLNSIRLLTLPPASSRKRSLIVGELLQETVHLLEPMLQDSQIELKAELLPEPLEIFGDPDQLKQVFLNILQNATDAVQGAGTIYLSSSLLARAVRIAVEDDGPGIPDEFKAKIFDPFFTTKADGTGLGLAISQNIIRDHGGSISIHPSALGGTNVTIELPLRIS
jgi:two-component system sensor kinase FixL